LVRGTLRRMDFWRRDAGQSLVEFGLMLPLLLIAFIGVADVGRLFFYTSMISSAAREGAMYGASHPNTVPDCSGGCTPLLSGLVLQSVCDSSGSADYGSPCPAGLRVASATYGPGRDADITVTYEFHFIITSLASRLIPNEPLILRAASRFAYRG
jgi:hypothetical protein